MCGDHYEWVTKNEIMIVTYFNVHSVLKFVFSYIAELVWGTLHGT